MKRQSVVGTLLGSAFAAAACLPAYASNFGTPAVTPKPAAAPAAGTPAAAPQSAAAPAAAGPQPGTAFRIVKPDGATVIQQASMGTSPADQAATLNVSDKDAFQASNGKCAFNVVYDEVSPVAVTGTTNRLYSNDALVAQNTKIDLQARVVKSVWTQPYLVPGVNNVRIVVNADSPAPGTKWVRVNVAGTCGAAAAKPAEPPKPAPAPAKPEVKFAPGSAEWNNLNTIAGYSNYAATQLKSANYPRYADLVKLNAAITAIVNAKVVTQDAYNSTVTAWNTFVTDPQFKTAMAAVVPQSDKPADKPAEKPAATPAPAPAPKPADVKFAPGSAEWSNLNSILGASNYATAQLKTANYARYADLVKLNAAITAIVNAKVVTQDAYNSTVTAWNTFATDPKFKSALAAVVPQSDKPADKPAEKPAATPAPAPKPADVKFAPGSAEWNNLNSIWGYSNYATTQLKTAGYARYADLAKLNAAVTAAINAKVVGQDAYNGFVTTWNTFVSDPKFKALMASVVPAAGTK
jgi:predicted flap endonuclease-1-like 5' DNA nuclease